MTQENENNVEDKREEENSALTAGKSFIENPKVQTYLKRATQSMLFFAILGCALIVGAVMGISYVFDHALESALHH